VLVWGEKKRANGNIVTVRNQQGWVDAERNIITGLGQHDLKDVYRSLNGYELEAFSFWQSKKEQVTSRRFDHIFASASLNAVACRYIKNLVEKKLSDHAAIEAEFAPV
jgi:endonuclease/exonuclease/phosphatase family metal-dependent hydrolase